MLRNLRRSYRVPVAPPGTVRELCCEGFAVQPPLGNLPIARVSGTVFLPLLLDNAAISQFGLSRWAQARRPVVPQPDTLTCFAFGLGTSRASVGPALVR